MTLNRSALLVGLGIATGSAVTAVIFLLFSSDFWSEESELQLLTEGNEIEQDPAPEIEKNIPFSRDISGKGVIKGTVRNAEGAGIESAIVRIHLTDQPWSHPDPPLETETDSQGNFAFEGLSEDLIFQVWAVAPGTASASKKEVSCGNQVDFVLEEGASIELSFVGLEKDSDHPIKILLAGTDLWPIREAKITDASRLIIEGLRDGEYVLWAESGGLAYISPLPIGLKKGDDLDIAIEFQKANGATVRVLDRQGLPLAKNSTVTVQPISSGLLSKTVSVEPGGTATIVGLTSGGYTVVASAEGYVESPPAPLLLENENSIILELGATITGFIRTPNGEPISGASLAIDQEMGSAVVSLPQTGGRQFRRRLMEAEISGWPRMYQLEKGVVVPGPSRMPLPEVYSDSNLGPTISWRPSNLEGSFSLDGLPSGRLSAWATHPDYVALKKVEITLEPGGSAKDVVIIMQPGSSLTVRATDERGYPLADSEIRIYDQSGELLAATQTESDGYATLKGLPGSFRLEATSEGRVPTLKKVEGKTGRSMELVLIMPPADKILYGRVTNADGFGVGNVPVTARSSGRGQAHVLTGVTQEDGTFALEGAGSQRYHVTAEDDEKGAARFGDASYKENIILVLNQETGHQNGHIGPIEPDHDFGVQDSLAGGFEIETAETIETEFGQADELPVTGPPPGRGGLPITVGGGPGRVVVTSVSPNSQIAEAGLSKGDLIIAIDGKKVTGPGEARRAISGKIGTVVLLNVDGNDGPFTVVVQRVRVASK